jgi:hypothetical protein
MENLITLVVMMKIVKKYHVLSEAEIQGLLQPDEANLGYFL